MIKLEIFDLIYAQALEISAQTKVLTKSSQAVSTEILDLSVSVAEHQEFLQKMFRDNLPTTLRDVNEKLPLGYSYKSLFALFHKYPFLAAYCSQKLQLLLEDLGKSGVSNVPDLESFVGQSLQM